MELDTSKIAKDYLKLRNEQLELLDSLNKLKEEVEVEKNNFKDEELFRLEEKYRGQINYLTTKNNIIREQIKCLRDLMKDLGLNTSLTDSSFID